LLLAKEPRKAVFTSAFSGRPARGIQNRFIDAMRDKELLEFPLQNTLTGALRQWAVQQENAEYQSVWAGTRYRGIRPLAAAGLMQALTDELNAAQD
jgi:nitronate monooxygenase